MSKVLMVFFMFYRKVMENNSNRLGICLSDNLKPPLLASPITYNFPFIQNQSWSLDIFQIHAFMTKG